MRCLRWLTVWSSWRAYRFFRFSLLFLFSFFFFQLISALFCFEGWFHYISRLFRVFCLYFHYPVFFFILSLSFFLIFPYFSLFSFFFLGFLFFPVYLADPPFYQFHNLSFQSYSVPSDILHFLTLSLLGHPPFLSVPNYTSSVHHNSSCNTFHVIDG